MFAKSLFIVGLSCSLLGLACSHNQKTDDGPRPPASMKASSTPQPKAAATPKSEPAPAVADDKRKEGDDAIYFDFDSSLVRDDARPVLQQLAKAAKANPSSKIRIEGNCDERGTTEYNLALGQQRAEAAKQYLRSLGVPDSRIVTTSFGSERPQDSGHDEGSWSRNRRDDLKVQ